MVRIGFNSILKAKQALAYINNIFQQNGFLVSPGSGDKAKTFIEVPERMYDEVVLNFRDYIVYPISAGHSGRHIFTVIIMNTEELRSRVSVKWWGSGTYKVTIKFAGTYYSCFSHNSLAYDRLSCSEDDIPDNANRYGYTYKQALQHFWDYCKSVNGLDY